MFPSIAQLHYEEPQKSAWPCEPQLSAARREAREPRSGCQELWPEVLFRASNKAMHVECRTGTAAAAKTVCQAHLSGKQGVEATAQRYRWGATTH